MEPACVCDAGCIVADAIVNQNGVMNFDFANGRDVLNVISPQSIKPFIKY
jgi:hypothetical protein